MSEEMTDAKIEAGLGAALAKIEATKALHDLLLGFKQKRYECDYTNYNEQERKEITAIKKRHLLRRIFEESSKCGIKL